MKKCFAVFLSIFFLASVQLAQSAELPNFTELASKCGPAVVNINSERKTSSAGAEEFFGEMFRNMPPGFEKFFEQFGGNRGDRKSPRGRKMPHKQKSLGSGFFVSADGYIVTNNHVVEGADVINVTMDNNGKSRDFKATLIGADEETDLALLKVEASNLPYLTFGNSDNLKVGEWLLAIGNPFGLDHTVTAGILSAKGRNIHAGPFDNFLQTDASINPGNSGGPLLNMSGQVVGINTAIIASGQGIGFAIPSNMAAKIIDQIKNGKKVSRGWIGVTIQDVDEPTSKALGLKDARGALVGSVMENEPAHKAGIKDGDIILAVDGQDIEDYSALLRAIADRAPGTTAILTIWRDGRTMDVKVTLGERKAQSNDIKGKGKTEQGDDQLGISVRGLNKSERERMKISGSNGVIIVNVDADKPGAEADLRPGDVILKANQTPIASPEELSRVVKDAASQRGAVMLQIQRGRDVYFKGVTLGK